MAGIRCQALLWSVVLLGIQLHISLAQTPTPKTTTQAPTTPKTTTPSPTTTTAAPIPVTPVFPNNIGNWNVSSGNVTCILIKSAIQLVVNYTDINNTTKISVVDVPNTAQVSGSCVEQNVILTWPNHQGLNNTLTFVFNANETQFKNASALVTPIPAGKFAIVKVNAVIYKDETTFPNATDPTHAFIFEQDKLAAFPASLNHSYACGAEETIGATSEQLTVRFQNTQIEAFRKTQGDKPDGNFSAAEHCAADEVSSGSIIGTVIVSILIVVLLALGAAFLVTYVLKKRRAGGSGYENM